MSDERVVLDSARTLETVEAVANELRKRTNYTPRIGIVCGSGLGKIASLVSDADVIPYHSVPGFPRSAVAGHAGNLLLGRLPIDVDPANTYASNEVLVMQGRCHAFEGHTHWHASLPVRVMQQLGVRILVLTSAVGSLHESVRKGDVVVVRDHLNLPAFGGRNPLFGLRDPRLGPRVMPVDNMYDLTLRRLALQSARELQLDGRVHSGSLGVNAGPQFEGVAEARWFRDLGMKVMGMSMAHEAIQARHCGMKVMALTVVSNGIATDYQNAAYEEKPHGQADDTKDTEHLDNLQVCERACDHLIPILVSTLQKAVKHSELFELTTYADGWWKE